MWNNFEQSPLEDETITNAFSSRGIFRITSDDEIVQYPCVQAAVQNNRMFISIDKTVFLLEDEMVAKCSLLSFNTKVDVLAISQTGNLVVCGLNDGDVHVFFIKGIPLFSRSIKKADVNIMGGKTFASIQQFGNNFCLTCTNGNVYSLTEIDESFLECHMNISLKENENVSFAENVYHDIALNHIFGIPGFNEITAALLIKQHFEVFNNETIDKDPLLIAGTHQAIIIRSAKDDVVRLNIPECFQGVKHIYNFENFIIVLTYSGHLLEVCPFTKLLFYPSSMSDILIDDLIVMECSDDNIEILALTKYSPDSDRTIKILNYPALKCSSELDVMEHSWLIQQPKCSVTLYYFTSPQCNVNNIPSVLEMISVSETHPSERFKKLIAKGRLEEAEVFGAQFELCLQPIYEAKARRVLVEMDSLGENNPELISERFSELMKLLQSIQNKEFFRQHRMFNMPNRTLLEKYLKEVLTHLDEEDDESDILEIMEQLYRLKTLTIIDPYEVNSEWQKFVYHPNLIKYITSLFKSDMPMACLIWKRHSSSLLPILTENKLRDLLNVIPNDTKPFNLLQWLRQFVPIVSNTHPNIMPLITEWSIQKIRSLQYAEHWPEIGLEFSTKVTEIFEDLHFMHSDVRRQHERNIGKLRDVVNALEDLFVLKKSYNLIFTLDNYLQDSIDETAKYILLRVHLDNLKSLVNDFLYPIYQERGSSPIAAIKRYIALLVASKNSFSTWLERSVVCIELLHNEDDRLEAALLVLQNSPVPWPETVLPLTKLRYSTHPLALKINTEYEIQVIKIMKVKYGWPTNVASDINLNLFMFRIIKMDLPDMLEDIKVLTKAAPEIASGVNSNCCYQMVKHGKLEEAYEFYKTLKSNKNSHYASEVTNFFANLLENVNTSLSETKMEEKNFIEFFKLITPLHCLNSQKRLKNVQNSFVLRYKYGLEIGHISELMLKENRLKHLQNGIENIIKRSQDANNICKYFITEISELSSALNFSKMLCLKYLCQRMKCLILSCALVYNIMEIGDCNIKTKDDYIEMALELLAQQIQFTNGSQSSTLAALLNENDPLAFPLAYELLVRASIVENSQYFDLVELINYVRIASTSYSMNELDKFYGNRQTEISKLICEAIDASAIAVGDATLNFSSIINNSFDVKVENKTKKRYSVSLFDEVMLMPQQQKENKVNYSEQLHIAKFVSRTLLFIVVTTPSKNDLFNKLKNMILKTGEPPLEVDEESVKNNFFLSLQHLINNKIHDVWYIMAQYLLDYQKRHDCKLINSDFISLQMPRVFRNTLSHKDVNFLELFVMLTADSYSKVLLEKLENDMRTDQQKINLLTLSEMYNVHFEEKANVEAIRNKRIKHYYYMEFCKQDPSIKGKFNAEIDSIEQLLKEFSNKQLDVHLLERMSRDFQLDYQKMLVTQVVSILQAQEMQYDIKPDSFGDEELVMITTVEHIKSLCEPYINEIKNVDLLTSKLKHFINEIHIYFYELYLSVIEILLHFEAVPKEMQVWISILHFLKHKMTTRRRNRPGQLETDMWFESQKEIGILPKISRYRLPFKPIVEQPLKDILDTELNVDNCESWFPLIQMHMMLKGSTDIAHNCDYFCMSAVKNSIGEYKNRNDSETWHLHPTNNAFLKSILRLVKHVHNPSKAFMILYFVANYAPDGADQVEASYECYKFAMKNENVITDIKCQEQLLKIKRKYPTLKTQHLLYVYGLTDDKLMRLIETPSELIYHLYHSDILLKGGKLDINAVVQEIADLHNLNLEPIQFKLLQKWLSFTVDTSDGTIMDETLFEDQNLYENNTEEFNNAAENVIRAKYIINSWPIDVAVQFLVANIFPPDGSVNTSKQLQMYECYFKLYDGSTTFDNMFSQKQYITLKCVHELKKLGYNSSLEKFAESNKIDILKTIWSRKSHNPNTLQILANICLGFEIYIPKIWNGILKRMVMLNMVKDLNALVDFLSCKPQLLHTEGLIMAWECVLLDPFKIANQTRSFEQEDQLHKTLFRLQSCPVVHSLNLFRFAETCLRLDRPHMAAVFLSFCRTDKQKIQIKELITLRNDKMRQDILNLEDVGILPFVLNFALKELNL